MNPSTAYDRPTDVADQPDSTILSVRGLNVDLRSSAAYISIAKDVTFDIGEGEVVGLVGESGSGKSVTASSILRLLPPSLARISGQVRYGGEDLLQASMQRLRAVRGSEIGLITQDALTALDPVFTIGHQIIEAITSHRSLSRAEATAEAIRLLEEVGISDPAGRLKQYPHELSGGMRQRVLLAIALCNAPKLLIADEPTTALDVTIQAQLVRLLAREARTRRMAMLLITHDLRLVAGLCDKLIVMYAGRIVESGPARDIYQHPTHPYAAALHSCAIGLTSRRGTPLTPIPGNAPDPAVPMPGCAFAPRCTHAWDRCHEENPQLRLVRGNQWSACHLNG
jgi:oligopeptide/dipeptide ABC transporter ATP-binding protein